MEKYSNSGSVRDADESCSIPVRATPEVSRVAGINESHPSGGEKKKHSSIHAILLVGILSGWVGSVALYAVGAPGRLRVSALIIISVMWMIAFFSVGSVTLRK